MSLEFIAEWLSTVSRTEAPSWQPES